MIFAVELEKRKPIPALLLIGPTGSGKTPLGELLENRGLWGRRCLHFDFGAELRQASENPPEMLTTADLEVIRRVLMTNALLEDAEFGIARKLLENFIMMHRADSRTIIIMNGLPRHEGQAKCLVDIITVRSVVSLECSPETVIQRIAVDAGGDRAGRVDDSLAEIENKLEIFKRRTAPLIDYYRDHGAKIIHVEVTASSTAADMLDAIEEASPGS
jgi:adenylate kinase